MTAFTVGPVIVPQEITLQQFNVGIGSLNAEGITADGAAALVSFAARVPLCRPLPKPLLERLHLEKFRIDWLVQRAELPFDAIERGTDPPDFRAGDAPQVGLDLSALTISQQRLAYHLFDTFLEQVVAVRPPLDNLTGTHIRVWFDFGSGLPPKRTDKEIATRLIETLRTVRLNRSRLAQFYMDSAIHGLPPQFPDWYPIYHLPDKEAGFEVCLVQPGAPMSPERHRCGFDCTLHMSMFIDTQFVHNEIRRLVDKHDKNVVQWLLLSLGGPDLQGWSYPAEEVMFNLVARSPAPVSVANLRRITLHRWWTGESVEIPVTHSAGN
jgi:hypothetical protein